MHKHNFHAAHDIKNDAGEVIVKAGGVAATVESDLPVERVLAGLQTGLIVPKKDVPKEKPATEPKADQPATAAKKT